MKRTTFLLAVVILSSLLGCTFSEFVPSGIENIVLEGGTVIEIGDDEVVSVFQGRSTREATLNLEETEILEANCSEEDIYEPGSYNITVQFNTTEEIQMNMTVGVCPANDPNGWDNHTYEWLGPFGAGENTTVTAHQYNFVNEGDYWLNVTLWNGTSNDTDNVTYSFEDIYNITIYPDDVEFQGVTPYNESLGSAYANDTMDIEIWLSNNGNKWLRNRTTVLLNISSSEMDIYYREYDNITDPLDADESVDVYFQWTPEEVGEYTVNVSYSNNEVDGNTTKYYPEFNITVEDIIDYDLELLLPEVPVFVGGYLNAWIIVTNIGNAEYDFEYDINVSKTDLSYDEQYSTGSLEPGDYDDYMFALEMDEEGDFTITITMEIDGGEASMPFTVNANNSFPEIADDTVLAAAIYAGDEVTFKANYTDPDDEEGYVALILDGVWNATEEEFQGGEEIEMELENETSPDFTGGEIYYYTWVATVGVHNYSFYCDDDNDGYDIIIEAGTFTVSPAQSKPTLTDQTILPTAIDSNDEIDFNVRYTDANGDAGNVKIRIDTYNTSAGDASNGTWDTGAWTAMQNTSDGWATGVNFTFSKTFDAGKYRYSFKTSDAVLSKDVITDPVEFTVTEYVPPVTTGMLEGYVNDDLNGVAVAGAKVIVEIYTEESVNISGNVTVTRLYANLSAVTNVTGYFSIGGITLGTWNVLVYAVGYLSFSQPLNFTSIPIMMNFTIIAGWPPTYRITGKVVPVDATVKCNGKEVDVNRMTGEFVIELLINGNYSITVDHSGYRTQLRSVTINGSDVNIGSIFLTNGIPTFKVEIGPFRDRNGNPIKGITVTFYYDGQEFSKTTDEDGMATFSYFPLIDIPSGTNITARLDDKEYTWQYGDALPVFKAKADEEDDFPVTTMIIIALGVISFIFLLILIGKYRQNRMKKEIDIEERDRKKRKEKQSKQLQQYYQETMNEVNRREGEDYDDDLENGDYDEDEDEFYEADRTNDYDEVKVIEEIEEKVKRDLDLDSSEEVVEEEEEKPTPRSKSSAPVVAVSYKEKLSALPVKEVRASMKNMIPDHIVTHQIASGGFATVYRAMDNSGKQVAVKLPKFLDETVDISILKNFEAEANIWKNLKHDNIVEFYHGGIRPVPYMVIELMEGGDLKHLMANHSFSVQEAMDLMLQILDGMAFAHRMASVHRDIKPENILFTRDGVPKITDWGIGKFMASEGVEKTVGTKGTLAYGSPEQISKKKFGEIDWQTDVFQLGIVFYEMLTGINPFHDDDALGIIGKITGETPAPPSHINPDVPKSLDRIVLKALSKDKKGRWASADIMFDRLKTVTTREEEDLKQYKKSLHRALEDGTISEDEEAMLKDVRDLLGVTMRQHAELLKEMMDERSA